MGSESRHVSVRPVDVHEVDVVGLEAPKLSLRHHGVRSMGRQQQLTWNGAAVVAFVGALYGECRSSAATEQARGAA